ncbi:MAG TPA: hypothetical protein VF516_47975, partial [Kofleriaceae bacterium]
FSASLARPPTSPYSTARPAQHSRCARSRKARLVARGQPELAIEDMHAWAAYLCGQADALGCPVIDTSTLDIEQATDALVPYVIQG